MKPVSSDVAPYLYKATLRICIEYYCYVWTGYSSWYLDILDKLKKRVCGTIGPSRAVTLELLAQLRNIVRSNLFCRYYFGICSCEPVKPVLLPYSRNGSSLYFNRMHDFSASILRCYNDVYVSMKLSHIGRVWNSLPAKRSYFIHDLNGFKRLLSTKSWDIFFSVDFMKSRNEKLCFPIKRVYDLYSRYSFRWYFRTQNIKANQK